MTKVCTALAGALLILPFSEVVSADTVPACSPSAVLELRLTASADRAFRLFDPIHESLWEPHWKPRFLGAPRAAAGLVFITTGPAGTQTIWLLDRYDSSARNLRYVNVSAGRTLTQLDIAVEPRGPSASEATVHHTQTALDSTAAADVCAAAREFPSVRSHWEAALNAALQRSR